MPGCLFEKLAQLIQRKIKIVGDGNSDLAGLQSGTTGSRCKSQYKQRFFRWLEKKVDHFEPGDIVFIRGMTPWDEFDEHSHSFFVFETDPVSGVPIAIAGNAGPANLWSWETEARRTPNRTVRDRIRPKLSWLESFLTIDRHAVLEPPALVSGKK